MAHLDFSNLTVDSINQLADEYIKLETEINDRLALIPNDQLSWDTLIQPQHDFSEEHAKTLTIFEMSSFHVDDAIRQACSDCETKLSQFSIEQNMRKDSFEKFKHYYYNQFLEEQKSFTAERIRYMEESMKSYRMDGMELDDEKYEKVKEIKKEISKLSNDFSLNLNNYNKEFSFTKEELEGMPEKWLESRIQDNFTYKVTLKYPDYVPLMEYCKNRETRKMMSGEFGRRCYEENKTIADKIFKLRHELGELFGFELYSDYQLQKRMAKNTTNVMNFINDLKDKIAPVLVRDYENLNSVAKEDNLDKLNNYDISYYSRIFTEKESELNKEELKKFFPLDQVTKGMFEIYETLLQFKFNEITEQHKQKFWHEEVKLYEVTNSDNSIQGYFYLDLHPRPGKYGHAAVFPIIRGSMTQYPVCIMACNFPKTENLSFDDVETYFHEFGHVMHSIASRPEIASFAGTSVARDAVECPSQMLEEWCYRPNALKVMAPEITDDIIEKLNKQKNLLQGYFTARQLSFCFIDMALHGKEYDSEYNALYSKILQELNLPVLPENHGFIQTFGHLMGYQAGYYGYLYSKCFAVCMFEEKFKGHELDPEVGMQYRHKIIAPGNTRDFMDLMIDFLGHEPSNEPFINSLLG